MVVLPIALTPTGFQPHPGHRHGEEHGDGPCPLRGAAQYRRRLVGGVHGGEGLGVAGIGQGQGAGGRPASTGRLAQEITAEIYPNRPPGGNRAEGISRVLCAQINLAEIDGRSRGREGPRTLIDQAGGSAAA